MSNISGDAVNLMTRPVHERLQLAEAAIAKNDVNTVTQLLSDIRNLHDYGIMTAYDCDAREVFEVLVNNIPRARTRLFSEITEPQKERFTIRGDNLLLHAIEHHNLQWIDTLIRLGASPYQYNNARDETPAYAAFRVGGVIGEKITQVLSKSREFNRHMMIDPERKVSLTRIQKESMPRTRLEAVLWARKFHEHREDNDLLDFAIQYYDKAYLPYLCGWYGNTPGNEGLVYRLWQRSYNPSVGSFNSFQKVFERKFGNIPLQLRIFIDPNIKHFLCNLLDDEFEKIRKNLGDPFIIKSMIHKLGKDGTREVLRNISYRDSDGSIAKAFLAEGISQ